MTRRRNPNVVREQNSIFYFSPEQSDIPTAFEELYTRMFLEDVSKALLPAWASQRGSKVSVEITPTNSDLEEKLSAALDISRQAYNHHDLGSALSEFLRLTMFELCLNGRVVFEIAYLRKKPDAPKDGFDLIHLKEQQLFRVFGHWYQFVPSDIAQEQNVPQRIHLPAENLAVFTLPGHLKRMVSKTMTALSAVSDHRWHDLATKAHSEQLPYDFSTHERSMRLALAEAVKEIGWTARGSFSDKVTNYYSIRQDLRFKLFLLEVREALLAQLNALLKCAGRALGWSAQLSISGMTTRSALERALDQLASGKKPFTEIMDEIRSFEH